MNAFAILLIAAGLFSFWLEPTREFTVADRLLMFVSGGLFHVLAHGMLSCSTFLEPEMNDMVADTLIWAAFAAIMVIAVGFPFIWRPWARGPKPPHHHPAE